MSTENETWRDASSSEENSGAGRDGNQFNREGGYNRPSYNRENGDRPYRPRFNNEMGIARNVLIAATVLIARVLTRMERMATVLTVPATTAKAATVPSALTATMPVATVLTAPATMAKAAIVPSVLMATGIVTAVRSVVRRIMIPMPSIARRSR